MSEWFRGAWSPVVDAEGLTGTGNEEAADWERSPRVRRPGTLASPKLRVCAAGMRAGLLTTRVAGPAEHKARLRAWEPGFLPALAAVCASFDVRFAPREERRL